jgi:hypothetical protein
LGTITRRARPISRPLLVLADSLWNSPLALAPAIEQRFFTLPQTDLMNCAQGLTSKS